MRLQNASRNGHLEVVQNLVENGANVNEKDNEGFNPIQTANQITGFAVEKVKANPIIGVILVLVGVLIGILATYYFVRRDKTE